MSLGDIKTFEYSYQGLSLVVNAIEIEGGNTRFVVKCVDGHADINAIYWDDGANDKSMFDAFSTKKDNSLNMNGAIDQSTGQKVADWDGGIKLSDTGLARPIAYDPVTNLPVVNQDNDNVKATYLEKGDELWLNSSVKFADLETVGLRATSTSNPEGSIKAADTVHDGATIHLPEVSVNDVTVNEDIGTMTFTVTLSGGYPYAIDLDWATADDSGNLIGGDHALAGVGPGSDYTASSGHIHFDATDAPGPRTQTFTVPITNDATPEQLEHFLVNLSNVLADVPGPDLAVGGDLQGIGNIEDTDQPPPPPVVLPPPNVDPKTGGLSPGAWKQHSADDVPSYLKTNGMTFDKLFKLDGNDNSTTDDRSWVHAYTTGTGKDKVDHVDQVDNLAFTGESGNVFTMGNGGDDLSIPDIVNANELALAREAGAAAANFFNGVAAPVGGVVTDGNNAFVEAYKAEFGLSESVSDAFVWNHFQTSVESAFAITVDASPNGQIEALTAHLNHLHD